MTIKSDSFSSTEEIKRLEKKVEALERKLQNAIGKDKLTGLASKLEMNKNLKRAFAVYKRESKNLFGRVPNHFSIIFLDLDRFKPINDGNHLRGDRVLIEFARFLKKVTREVDTVARFGGDEFYVLAPETSKEKASALCEKIRTGLESYTFDSKYEPIKLSCSFGVASTSEGITLAEDLIKKADEMMQVLKDERKKNRL